MNAIEKKQTAKFCIGAAGMLIGTGCGLFVRKLVKGLSETTTPVGMVAILAGGLRTAWAIGVAVDRWCMHCYKLVSEAIDFEEAICQDLGEMG